MPPEQAARGILLFEKTADENADSAGSRSYADISDYSAWGNNIA